MRMKSGLAVAALLASLALPVYAADHLLLSEFAVTPTNAEFVEIYNPTAQVVDLTDYYISDFVLASGPTQNYWRMVDGTLIPDPGFDTDFLARFPSGTEISPGQTLVIALHDDLLFSEAWSGGGRIVRADFEMLPSGGDADDVPDMLDPGPARVGAAYIQANAGLANGREVVVLFRWDGVSDLVQDVDIVQWSNAGPVFNTVSPVKTGVSVDGPDADNTPTPYKDDTSPAGQDVASLLEIAHDFGLTVSRIDFDEGIERLTNGNGITAHDETSENYSATWAENTEPSIGSLGPFGPPTLLAGEATAATSFELLFSRTLDETSAEDLANYTATRLSEPDETPLEPLAIASATLSSDGRTVVLTTARQVPTALYEIGVQGVLSEDLGEGVAPGTNVRLRGFNDRPGVRLDLPARTFSPQLDHTVPITYTAPQGEAILLRLFDLEGREVHVLAEETVPAGGVREIDWDGRDRLRQRVPAGVYVLHLELPDRGDETVAPIVIGVPDEETLR